MARRGAREERRHSGVRGQIEGSRHVGEDFTLGAPYFDQYEMSRDRSRDHITRFSGWFSTPDYFPYFCQSESSLTIIIQSI